MTTRSRRSLLLLLALPGLLSLAACGRGPAAPTAAIDQEILIAADDIYTLRNAPLGGGVAITGSIQPERRADLRAEVAATVLATLRENGEPVHRGDLLVRLDATSIRDALASAESARRASAQSLEQATRQLERQRALRASGMASAQALDDAETRRNNAQSDLEAAKARMVSASQQLDRTEVRAPFDGVVSDRRVSAGDTVQVGKELIKVIDPASMRFEGLIAAEQVGALAIGNPVRFRVHGYGEREFLGQVRRINPVANATTRQVEVIVAFTEQRELPLAGLYAEGRVETESRQGLALPESALVRQAGKAYVWRFANGRLGQVEVGLGERDARSGRYPVSAGLAEGDQVLRYPSGALRDGQPARLDSTTGG